MSIVSLPTLHFRWDNGNLLQLHCVCQKAQAEEDQRFVNHLDLNHEDDEIFKEQSPATAGEWIAANPDRFQWLQVPYLVRVDPVRSLGEILGEGRSRPMPAEVAQRIEELATAPEEAEAQKPEQHWAHNAPETRALIRGKIFYANVDDFTKQCLNFMAQLERERDKANERIVTLALMAATAATLQGDKLYCSIQRKLDDTFEVRGGGWTGIGFPLETAIDNLKEDPGNEPG